MISLGRKIIHLEVGQPNFNPPARVIASTINALRDGHTTYIPNDGDRRLREVISKHYSTKMIPTSMNQIVVTAGSMLSMFSLFSILLKPDDECLIPSPGFGNYLQGIAMVHAKPVPYPTSTSTQYLSTVTAIENVINERTKCLVICNPGNPTGAVYDRDLLRDLVVLTKKHQIFLISDG
jgi:aspartate/methionine/tyrosine aminotransferase